jgi:membrane associated rhomboid family serine protease
MQRRYSFRTYGPSALGGGVPPAVKALIITNCAVFLLQALVASNVTGGESATYQLFGLVPTRVVFQGMIWQPFTYLFLHGSFWHLLINMFVLWMFGRDLEGAWGRRRFFQYYFICGIGAGLFVVLIKILGTIGGLARSDIPTIGASGAIYGLLMGCAILFPDRRVWMFPFPGLIISMRMFALIWGAIEFFGTINNVNDGVSHVAHLSGMFVGWVYLRRGSMFYGLRNRYSDWQRRRLRRKFEVYMREQDKQPPSRPDNWVN